MALVHDFLMIPPAMLSDLKKWQHFLHIEGEDRRYTRRDSVTYPEGTEDLDDILHSFYSENRPYNAKTPLSGSFCAFP